MDNKIGLYQHNMNSYEKIKQGFLNKNVVSIIQATGTGKSYNALQLVYDNSDKKVNYFVPSTSIIEHVKEIIDSNPNLDLVRDFSNLQFRTYQSLINLSHDELAKLDIDLLILDEFHHIGAPIWGDRIKTLVQTHPKMKIFGMTAYTVRDRGTSYERDMANPETDELFSKSVVSRYDLCDAMIDGVLSKPIYKSGYVYLEKTTDALAQRLEKLNHDSKDYKELYPLLKEVKQRLHDTPSVKDIFKANIKPNGKYIYFCPLLVENGKNDIESIMQEGKRWIKEMGLSEAEYKFYISTSDMGKEGRRNRQAFYNNEDLDGNKIDDKLRIMFALNQYNEGVHVPDLDGVIMGRETKSDIVFFEQLGRALSARGKTKEEYNELYSKSIDELKELCNKRQIKVKNSSSKEEIVEQLLAPTIIDLANNIGFIKDLENNLKDRVKKVQTDNIRELGSRIIHLKDTSFDIQMLNENLFEILEYMSARLTMRWEDKYALAKIYYEHYHNLSMPQSFKTINGIDYDENGINLGRWIATQRQAYHGREKNKLSEDQIKLLEAIDMRFEVRDNFNEWQKKYNLAKKYYEHHHHLNIPQTFKTTNGYEYDENGINLGRWISHQRQAYHGRGKTKITEDQIQLLKEIDMQFEVKDRLAEWQKKYNLAKKYYEHHHHLEIPQTFKTINGYEHDEDGIALGFWWQVQKTMYKKNKMAKNRIELLEKIGANFQNAMELKWQENYELAKKYYEHYHHLKIPQHFKTTTGYDSDENGVSLGDWISRQRQAYNQGTLTEEKIEQLEKIEMNFHNVFKAKWQKQYELAKRYYEHNHHLEIPASFKTINGYDYDENGNKLGKWIVTQRQAYYGRGHDSLTEIQVKLLEKIEMKWYASENMDDRYQKEIIVDNNAKRKHIEILNRVNSYLNKYDVDSLPTVDEINSGMLDELNYIKREK